MPSSIQCLTCCSHDHACSCLTAHSNDCEKKTPVPVYEHVLHGRNETETVAWSWGCEFWNSKKVKRGSGTTVIWGCFKSYHLSRLLRLGTPLGLSLLLGTFLLLEPSPVHLDTLKALRPRLVNAATAFLFPCLDHSYTLQTHILVSTEGC